MSYMHPWRRVPRTDLHAEGLFIVRCALCNLRRDAIEVRGLNPDDDQCPMLTPDTCRDRNVDGEVCRLKPDHSEQHRGLFNSTWGWGAAFTAKMSMALQKPGARQDPQFICALCGQHYLDHPERWREHFDAARARQGAA